MRLSKALLGKPVCVRFWDHATGTKGKTVECLLYGVLGRYNQRIMLIRPWVVLGDDSIDTDDTDATILRSAVASIERMLTQDDREGNG